MTRSAETPYERRERVHLDMAIALSSIEKNFNSPSTPTIILDKSSDINQLSTFDHPLPACSSSKSEILISPHVLVPPSLDLSSPVLPASLQPALLAPPSPPSRTSSSSSSSRPRPPRLSNALILEARDRLRFEAAAAVPQPPSTPLVLPFTAPASKPPQSPLLSDCSGQLPPTLIIGPPQSSLLPPPAAPSDHPAAPLSNPTPSDPVSIPQPPFLPPTDAPSAPKPAARSRKKKTREPACEPSEASGSRSGTRVRKRSALGKASDQTMAALLRLEQPDEGPHEPKDVVPEKARRAQGARIRIVSSDVDEPVLCEMADRPVPPATPRQAAVVVLSSSPLSSPVAEAGTDETPANALTKEPLVIKGSEDMSRKSTKNKKKAAVGRKKKKGVGVRSDNVAVADEAPRAAPETEPQPQPADAQPAGESPKPKARGRPRREAEEQARLLASRLPGPELPASPATETTEVCRGQEQQECDIQQSACEVAPQVELPESSRASSKPPTPGPSSDTKADERARAVEPECLPKPTPKPVTRRPTLGLGGLGPKNSRPLAEIIALTNANKSKRGFRVGLAKEEKHRLHVKINPNPVVQRQVKRDEVRKRRKRKRGEYDSGEDSGNDGEEGSGSGSEGGVEEKEVQADDDDQE